jgi:hypothetical protein
VGGTAMMSLMEDGLESKSKRKNIITTVVITVGHMREVGKMLMASLMQKN